MPLPAATPTTPTPISPSPAAAADPSAGPPRGPAPLPRLRLADRHRQTLRCESLDELLPPEHPARDVLAFVETLDLFPLLEPIRSTAGRPGAPAFDPAVLLSLWLYATLSGIASCRQLEELCRHHLVFRWLAGDMPINYHTLNDFRTNNGEFLDGLLTHTIASLVHAQVVTLERVAQDGMRVRACAGASSFRRKPSLDECLEEARQQVELLKRQADEDPAAADRRSQAAQLRHADERMRRVQAARHELATLRQTNAKRPPSQRRPEEELRASTTDPEARKMKMPDGGYRPAFNAQFATDVASGMIVGVAVTNEGTDANEMPPMVEQVQQRCGKKPGAMLVDGGFAALDSIDKVESAGTPVYAPVREEHKQEKEGKDPYARKKKDTDSTARWRARMGTEEAKEIYKLRASTAEWVNAGMRNRRLYAVRVRGQQKVRTILLWQAVAHNLGRMVAKGKASPGDTARQAA